MDEISYIYIILPFTIVISYISARCYQNSIAYIQDKINPIAHAVEVVHAEPIASNEFVRITINN
jgi:hypothetical protein